MRKKFFSSPRKRISSIRVFATNNRNSNFLTSFHQNQPLNVVKKKFRDTAEIKNKFEQIDKRRKNYLQTLEENKEKMSKNKEKRKEIIENIEKFQKVKRKVASTVDENSFKFPSIITTFTTCHLKNEVRQKIRDVNEICFQTEIKSTFCIQTIFPISRIGSCLVVINKVPYLYGGVYRKLESTNHQRKSQKVPKSFEWFYKFNERIQRWEHQKTAQPTPEIAKNPCYHTCESYGRNHLIIVGGVVKQKNPKISSFNPYISLYNLQTKESYHKKWSHEVKMHASTVYNNILIVHGGYGQSNVIKNTLHIINIQSLLNNTPLIMSVQLGQPVAHHKIVTTYDIQLSVRAQLGSNDGIIYFGGENSEGLADNNLRIMKFSNNFFDSENTKFKKWEVLKVSGKKPCSRMSHSMNMLPKKGQIVVIGGRNWKDFLLDDIWVFDLLQMNWMQVQAKPNLSIKGGIANHGASVDGSKIYIYGGFRKSAERIDFWALETNTYSEKYKEKKKTLKKTFFQFSSKLIIANEKYDDDEYID